MRFFFRNSSSVHANALQEDRKKIIVELCQSDQVKCRKINFDKFSNLTEGYTVGYLLQFVERAIFYAHRNGIILIATIQFETEIFSFAVFLQITNGH